MDWFKAPSFYGIALFAYDMNSSISECRTEMRHPFKFKNVLKGMMIMEFLLYGILGAVGYIAYGNKAK